MRDRNALPEGDEGSKLQPNPTDGFQFENLQLAEPILRAVLMEGYTEATPIQSQSIGPIMEGRDVIGCAQTGTGKTAAFALPILHRLISQTPSKGSGRKIRVLVLASTRELASQIRDSFTKYGHYTPIRMGAIFGGVSQGPQERALRNGIDILVATPGRLIDLMEQGFVDLQHVRHLVLDEADRMLDMGFLPAIREIVRHVPKERQTLLFSATMPAEIVQLARDIIHDPVHIHIKPVKKTTELVDQRLCLVPQRQKIKLLITLIREMKPTRALVFSKTKHGADRIAKHLVNEGIRADAIHSNKSQNKRQRLLDEFKWDNPPILVATDIAARGIDVDGVSHVFNFDMPNDAETYVHRIGRTGRAGSCGIAISFCDPEERKVLRSIEDLLNRRLPIEKTIELPKETTSENTSQPRRASHSSKGKKGLPSRSPMKATERVSSSSYSNGSKRTVKSGGRPKKKAGRPGKSERAQLKQGAPAVKHSPRPPRSDRPKPNR